MPCKPAINLFSDGSAASIPCLNILIEFADLRMLPIKLENKPINIMIGPTTINPANPVPSKGPSILDTGPRTCPKD